MLLVMQNMMLKKGMFEESSKDQQSGCAPQYNDKNKGKTRAGKPEPISVKTLLFIRMCCSKLLIREK